MATTSLGITTEELNSGSFDIQNEVINGQFNVFPLIKAYDDIKYKDSKNNGAAVVVWPASFTDAAQPSELTLAALGYDPVNTNTAQTMPVNLQYNPWLCVYVMAISYLEQQVNMGPTKTLDLAKERVSNTQLGAMRRLDRHLTAGGEVGHANLLTFDGVSNATGLLEAAPFGSQAHSVGGLVKTTYNAFPLLLNEYYDFNNSINARAYDGISQVNSQMSVRAPITGEHAYIASPTCHANLGRLSKAHLITTQGEKTYDLGIPDIMIAGARVRASQWMNVSGSTKVSMMSFTPMNQPFMWLNDNKYKLRGWNEHPIQPVLYNMLFVGGQVCPKGLADAAMFVNGEQF